MIFPSFETEQTPFNFEGKWTGNKPAAAPVHFNLPLTNRSMKRKLKKENEKTFPHLLEIENNFLQSIFNPDGEESYEFLYQVHLEVYQKMVKWMKANKMFKYTQPNEHYFEEKYFPIETLA